VELRRYRVSSRSTRTGPLHADGLQYRIGRHNVFAGGEVAAHEARSTTAFSAATPVLKCLWLRNGLVPTNEDTQRTTQQTSM
jgi:hypothetical protein